MREKYFKQALIYFVQGEITKKIKIGKTNYTVEERLRNLQTGSPDKLLLIGVSFEPFSSEESLHLEFNEFRLHGEWFEPDESILDYVNRRCFKSSEALYHAYFEIINGCMTHDEALAMNPSELIDYVSRMNMNRLDGAIKNGNKT